jgi:serine/threonine-protein kinase
MDLPNSPDQPPRTLVELLEAIARDFQHQERAVLAGYARLYPHLWQEVCRVFPGVRWIDLASSDTMALPSTSTTGIPHPQGALRTLGDFELLELLQDGLWATVYQARHRRSGQRVVMKVLKLALRLAPPRLYEEGCRARAAINLSHPGLVAAVGFGRDAGQYYQAQEFVAGCSLQDWLDQHPAAMPWPQAARWLVQVAVTVQAAHAFGLTHGDLRPANLRLDGNGSLRVADLGLAGFLPAGLDDSSWLLERVLPYRSPEQASPTAQRATAASDIYALGACLYRLLTGIAPFRGQGGQLMAQRIHDQLPTPPRSLVPDLPAEVEAVVLQALSKQPHRRQRSPGQMARQLCRLLHG